MERQNSVWPESSQCRACVWGRLWGPEWDKWMRDVTGIGIPLSCTGKNPFHKETVLPKITCQPEEKLSLVLISGVVRVEIGEKRWQGYKGHRPLSFARHLWRSQRIRDTDLRMVFTFELGMMYFILPHVIFSLSQITSHLCICVLFVVLGKKNAYLVL